VFTVNDTVYNSSLVRRTDDEFNTRTASVIICLLEQSFRRPKLSFNHHSLLNPPNESTGWRHWLMIWLHVRGKRHDFKIPKKLFVLSTLWANITVLPQQSYYLSRIRLACKLRPTSNEIANLTHYGESVALLVARRTNNQPTIGRLRARGLLKQCVSQCWQVTARGELSAVAGRHSFFRAV